MEGVTIFVKKIPLSDLEHRKLRSTQNHFKLPPQYQYGAGSMGFGVWRELAAHQITTQWVLNEECQNFPLMYHSRVLSRNFPPKPLTAQELEERHAYVESWGGSPAVYNRAEAADTAASDVVIFMEFIPSTLSVKLSTETDRGNLTESNLSKLEKELNLVAAFMKSRGFLHFDSHFGNILANRDHVYFADFGLAISRRFDLSPEERAFFDAHGDYDRSCIAAELFENTIIAGLRDKNGIEPMRDQKGNEALDQYFKSGNMKDLEKILPADIKPITNRYGRIAALMRNFISELRRDPSKTTPYPKSQLALEWSKL